MAQAIKCYQALDLVPSINSGLHACNPRTPDVEAEGSLATLRVQGQPGLQELLSTK